MFPLHYLAGPVIGAVIGYCTNYIAVKMLFRPRRPVYLFGHKLPLTPGAIPKGKDRLAKAVANVVTTSLITPEDLEKQLTAPAVEGAVVNKLMDVMEQNTRESLLAITGSEDRYERGREKLTQMLTQQILEGVQNMDVGSIIVREGEKAVQEKLAGSMLAMFISMDKISAITGDMGGRIAQYLEEHGAEHIQPEVEAKLAQLESGNPMQILHDMDVDASVVGECLRSVYRRVIRGGAEQAISQLNLAAMIEEKINAMSVEELEKMVLAVMKKELNMIVNLGALIGLILGLLNIFL